jgi:hypothetical protein
MKGQYAWRDSNPSPQVLPDKELGNRAGEGGAESGAVQSRTGPHDADLARLVGAWPTLPDHVKTRILALADAAAGR